MRVRWTLGVVLVLFPACGGAGGSADAGDADGADVGPDDSLGDAADDPGLDDTADGDGSDVTPPPEGVFLPGDFGPVLATPDREMVLVRSIEPGDAWVVDEYDVQYRPRLSVVSTLTGMLQPINERTGIYLSFPKAGGVLHGRLSEDDRIAELLYTGGDGTTTTVLEDYSGFFDWYSVIPVSKRLDWTLMEQVLFRPSTRSVFPAPGFGMWASDTSGALVVGVADGSVVLWNLDDGSREVLWDVSADLDGVTGAISADGTWAYAFTATWLRAFDLAGGTSQLVAGVGAVRPHIQSFALEPGGPAFYFVDDEGLKRVVPPATSAELLVAGRVAHHERTRDGSWWLLELDQDPASYCYRLLVLELATGTTTAGETRVCPEIVGYAVLSDLQRHVLWSDAPYNAMVGRFADFGEIRYCEAFRCGAPGTVAPDDRWLLVPTAATECGTGDACTLMRFDLEDPAGGLVPVFAAEHNQDWRWAEYVRFARGSPALTFGSETLSRDPSFGPCPNELHVARRGTWDHWNIDVAVKDVEVAADDALVYVTGRPDLPAVCPGWPSPADLEPGLRIVPAAGWTARP